MAEGIIGGFCLLSIGMLFILRQPEPEALTDKETPLPELQGLDLTEIEATPDNLEKTRYN